jgi:protein SCO1/2
MIKSKAPSLLLLLLLISHFSIAQTPITPQNLEIGIEEHLDEFLPLDIIVTNEREEEQTLESLIDKPTIINLVYYRCPGICSPLMQGLADVMSKVKLEPGKDYQVLTISFDPRESIDLGIRKKNNYLNMMSDPEPFRDSWKFFVSDSANIARLTNAVGFKYKRTGNDYLHAASICIVSPEGKITRYLNGTYFLPFEITMALTEASEGISAPTVNRVLEFCFSYDPVGQKYVLNMTRVAFPIISLTAVLLVFILVLQNRRNKKKIALE